MLQGGGALGACQADVFEALSDTEIGPDWVAGISIGAIDSGPIAGNPRERRVPRLEEFWELISAWRTLTWFNERPARSRLKEAGAAPGMLFGVSGFFTPRVPPAAFQPAGTPGAISCCDTTPLSETLERLIDFDLLNSGPVRQSVGARSRCALATSSISTPPVSTLMSATLWRAAHCHPASLQSRSMVSIIGMAALGYVAALEVDRFLTRQGAGQDLVPA